MKNKLKQIIEVMKLEAAKLEADAEVEECGYVLSRHLVYKAMLLRKYIEMLEKILK